MVELYSWQRRLALVLLIVTVSLFAGCKDDDSNVMLAGNGAEDSQPGDNGETGGGDGDPMPPGMSPMLCEADAPALEASSEDAVTQSTDIDGKTIDVHMTIFTPDLKEGECAPLVIQSHGFGGSRLTSLEDDVSDDSNAAELATRNARRAGYFVISFDQRGFGETEGAVMIENPDYEGQDIKAILDYAEKNLGGHLAYRQGDPVVGSLGLSYGGGFQLVGAGVDPRFDAIVPAATWYALPYSLNPNNTPKTVWLDLLVLLGVFGQNPNGNGLPPFLYEGFLQAQFGEISQDVIDEVTGNGLDAYCENMSAVGGVPQVDAFLVQGVNDTLFNLNEAVRNAQCLRDAGNDVRLLAQRTGHILPLFQAVQDAFGFDLDPTVKCGNATYDTSERMLSFLDEKLRGQMATPPVDKNCFVQDDDHGIVTDEIPVGGERYTIPDTLMTTGPLIETVVGVLQDTGNGFLLTILENALETVGNTLESVINLLTDPANIADVLTNDVLQAVEPELLAELTAPARQIELFTADKPMALAGIPTADLFVDGPSELDPIIFVGLGVQRNGESDADTTLINTQIAPLRGSESGEYKQQLVGVSTQLEPGDTVKLMLYGFHNQYYLSFNRVPVPVTVSGTVKLPLTPTQSRAPQMAAQ